MKKKSIGTMLVIMLLLLCMVQVSGLGKQLSAQQEIAKSDQVDSDYNIVITGGHGVHIRVTQTKSKAREFISNILFRLPAFLKNKLLSKFVSNDFIPTAIGDYYVKFDYDDDNKDYTRSGSFATPAKLDFYCTQLASGTVSVEVSIRGQTATRTGTVGPFGTVVLF